jgi:ATP:corrinoid adenosyltransferase
MSPGKIKKKSTNALGEKGRGRGSKIGEMVMLKKRMNHLEEKVMERLPYLIRMGVSFKKNGGGGKI